MTQDESSRDTSGIAWERDVPLLTNRFMLYDSAKLLAWTFLIIVILMSTILLVQGEPESIPPMVGIFGLMILGLMAMFMFVTLVVFWNRFSMRMSVNAKGASVDSTSRVGKAGNRLAIVLGLLARRPGLAGAGMLGAAQEHVGIDWREVHRIHEHPDAHVISIMNSWRVVLRLYCTPENYEPVLACVRDWAATGARKREARETLVAARPKRPSAAPRMLGLSIATALCGIGLMAAPFEIDGRLVAAGVAFTLALIWSPIGRSLLGLLSLCIAVGVGASVAREGFRIRHLVPEDVLQGAPEPSWSRYTGWSTLDGGEWWRLALTAAALVVLLVVQGAALRRRSPAASEPVEPASVD